MVAATNETLNAVSPGEWFKPVPDRRSGGSALF
jgi:hypothetical protein